MEEVDVSPSSSSSSRLKFLCSYGGRILPRPSDNHLRYVGGETRILTLPRSFTFTDLKHKISLMFTTTDVIIKYQLLHEDLDALISIRNDEDVCYMMEEYDRFSDRLFRLFIFPPTPTPADPAASPRHRYLDAINGGSSAVASGGTSPVASADSLFDAAAAAAGGRGMGMHRVRSTPNLRGNCGSQTTSPTAYRKTGAAGGYGGAPGLKVGGGGGFRQEIGYGCGCACSAAQLMRKYMGLPAAMVVEGSPPRRRFHVGANPPPIGAPMRVVWE